MAPRVHRLAGDVLQAEWVDGAPRRLAALDARDGRALGRLLRRAHGRRVTATGGLPGWASRTRTPVAYARGRGRDALAMARTPDERSLVQQAAARAADGAPRTPGGFAFLHGDLVEDNVVWPARGPVLVDWEFWRMGDPAEDLAYLAAMNRLPPGVMGSVLRGYRATADLARRARAWEPLVLADAGLWHRAHGDPARAAGLLGRARDALDA